MVAILGALRASDDYPHPVEPDLSFNESFLFHYAGRDQAGRLVGGLIRVANRPNQGYAEATVLVWLPDGTTLFNFERPAITGNDGWSVSGWTLEVLKPGGLLFRTRYEGSVLALADARLMADPKRGFQEPRTQIRFDLHHEGKGPLAEFQRSLPADGMPVEGLKYGTIGSHQFMKFSGEIAVEGGETYAISGYGWRDHNWGPRNWQGFGNHDYFTGNPGDDEGFALYKPSGECGYLFHRGPDQGLEVEDIQFETVFAPDGYEPLSMAGEFFLKNGERHTLTGVQKGYIPLRNKRGSLLTTIGYSLWEYEYDGRPCLGLGEFMRQHRINE